MVPEDVMNGYYKTGEALTILENEASCSLIFHVHKIFVIFTIVLIV